MKKHCVGLYGDNGHQILTKLTASPRAYAWQNQVFDDLDLLLKQDEIDIISLCSPVRKQQAADAERALLAGKHVLAEKPAAMTAGELDRLLRTAKQCDRVFHAQSGTVLEAPYFKMRQLVHDGVIGEVLSANAVKSYPWHDQRSRNDDIDGGLLLWCGIHAARQIIHITQSKLSDGVLQRFDSPPPGGGAPAEIALGVCARLANGGPVTLNINYLNFRSSGIWGYDSLRLFGRKGILEYDALSNVCKLIIDGDAPQTVNASTPGFDFWELFLDDVEGKGFPFSLEEEFAPDYFLLSLAGAEVNINSPIRPSERC